MKGKLIISSFFAAIGGVIFACAGIEGSAPLPRCAVVAGICLGWIFLVEYANR